jgi:hypothetical protein
MSQCGMARPIVGLLQLRVFRLGFLVGRAGRAAGRWRGRPRPFRRDPTDSLHGSVVPGVFRAGSGPRPMLFEEDGVADGRSRWRRFVLRPWACRISHRTDCPVAQWSCMTDKASPAPLPHAVRATRGTRHLLPSLLGFVGSIRRRVVVLYAKIVSSFRIALGGLADVDVALWNAALGALGFLASRVGRPLLVVVCVVRRG